MRRLVGALKLLLTFVSTTAQFDADLLPTVHSAITGKIGEVWSVLDFLGQAIETGMIAVDASTGRPVVEDVRKLMNSATHVIQAKDYVLWMSYYVDAPGNAFGYSMVNVSGVSNEYTFFQYAPLETCVSFGHNNGCMVDQFVDQRTGEPVSGAMMYGAQRVFGAELCVNVSEYATKNGSAEEGEMGYVGSGYGYGYGYGDTTECLVLPADVSTWVGPPYSEPWDGWSTYGYDRLSAETLRWWLNQPYPWCSVVDESYQPCYCLSSYRAASLPGVGRVALFELSFDIASIREVVGKTVGDESDALVFVLEGKTSRIIAASDNTTTWDEVDGDILEVEQLASSAMLRASWNFMSDAARTDADDDVSHIVDGIFWLRWIWLDDGHGLVWRLAVSSRIVCPAGYGVDRDDAIGSCFACNPGTFSDEASRDCARCASGTVAPISGSEACVPCQRGFFQNDGATQCERCIMPYTSAERATLCDMCTDGWYSPELLSTSAGLGNIRCEECPTHATCTDSQMVVNVGYWRRGRGSKELYECRYGANACPGDLSRNVTACPIRNDPYCACGYSGPLCSECAQRYRLTSSATGQECEPCHEDQIGLSNIIISGVVLVVGLALIVGVHVKTGLRKKMMESYKHGKTKGFILLQLFQVITQFASISQSTGDGQTYAEPATTFVQVLGVSNFDIFNIFYFKCALPTATFYTTLAVKCTLFPLGPVALLWTWANLGVTPAQRGAAYRKAAKLSLLWIEVILTTVSTTIAQTFICDFIDGEWRLRAELSLTCDSSSAIRRSWTTFAWIMLVGYVPLCWLCIVYCNTRIRSLIVTSSYGWFFVFVVTRYPVGFPLLLLCLLLPQRARIRELMVRKWIPVSITSIVLTRNPATATTGRGEPPEHNRGFFDCIGRPVRGAARQKLPGNEADCPV